MIIQVMRLLIVLPIAGGGWWNFAVPLEAHPGAIGSGPQKVPVRFCERTPRGGLLLNEVGHKYAKHYYFKLMSFAVEAALSLLFLISIYLERSL